MCGCKIKILTESGGASSLFQTEGTLSREGEGERVSYLVEGDEGELLISDTSLTMCRRGKCALQATFIEGKETQMMIGDSSLFGNIPVRTTRYILQREDASRDIHLRYELFKADNIQTFSLKIQLFFSEGK